MATPTADIDLATAQQILAEQPFSRLVGARLTRFGAGEAILEVDVRDDLRQQNGYLHGGMFAYAADNAVTFAAGGVLGPAVLTGGFAINYLRPGQGRMLRAHAVVVHAGSRQAVCRCDLYMLDDEKQPTLCAVAQGTVLTVRTG